MGPLSYKQPNKDLETLTILISPPPPPKFERVTSNQALKSAALDACSRGDEAGPQRRHHGDPGLLHPGWLCQDTEEKLPASSSSSPLPPPPWVGAGIL